MHRLKLTLLLSCILTSSTIAGNNDVIGSPFYYIGLNYGLEYISSTMFNNPQYSWNPCHYQGSIKATLKDVKFYIVYIKRGNRTSGILSIKNIKRFYHSLNGDILNNNTGTEDARLNKLPNDYHSYFSSTSLNYANAIHLFGTNRYAYGPGIAGAYGQVSSNIGENIGSMGNFRYLTFGPCFHFSSKIQRKRLYILSSIRLTWGFLKSASFEYPPRLFQYEIIFLLNPRFTPLKFAVAAAYNVLNYQIFEIRNTEILSGKCSDTMFEVSIGIGL